MPGPLRVASAPSAHSAFALARSTNLLVVMVALGTLAVLAWPSPDALTGRTPARMAVWGMPFEDRLFEDVYARGWEAANAGVRVDYGRFADIRTKYNAWFARGDGVEVMRLELTWYRDFVRRGMLEPLTPYIRDAAGGRGLSAEQLAKFPPEVMELLTIDGEIYALPEDGSQYGLFYNRAIFDEHNREFPHDPVEYPPVWGANGREWTWEDLRAAAKKLTRFENNDPVNGRITRAGLDFAVWAWPFLTLLHQAGGEAFNADGSVCTVNSPAGVRALEFLRAMQREDRSFDPSLGEYRDGVGADARFAAGRTAMMLDGSWRVPNLDLTAPGLDYAVAPLPRGPRSSASSSTPSRGTGVPPVPTPSTSSPESPGRPAVACGAVLWAVSSRAKHKDQAWEMLRWLVQDEQAAAYWDTLRVAPPANLSVLNSPAFRSTRGVPIDAADPSRGFEVPPMPPQRFESRAAWLLYAVTPHAETGEPPGFLISHPLLGDLYDELQKMLQEYLKPHATVTAQAALDGVVGRIHELMARSR
ncbi:MAG: ABC transporter substrate-binding protein [Phycisphaerales bacterium]